MQSVCREAFKDYMSSIICGEYKTGNKKTFWSNVKSLRRDNCGVAHLKKNGIMFTQIEAKADILNQQFASGFSHENTSASPDIGPCPYPDMPDITVNNPGIAKLLSGLNPHKACGPDQIPPRVHYT